MDNKMEENSLVPQGGTTMPTQPQQNVAPATTLQQPSKKDGFFVSSAKWAGRFLHEHAETIIKCGTWLFVFCKGIEFAKSTRDSVNKRIDSGDDVNLQADILGVKVNAGITANKNAGTSDKETVDD